MRALDASRHRDRRLDERRRRRRAIPVAVPHDDEHARWHRLNQLKEADSIVGLINRQ